MLRWLLLHASLTLFSQTHQSHCSFSNCGMMTKTPKQKAAAKKPPKKKDQKVKGKKNEDSRNAVPVCGASDHRIWRIFDAADERWVRSTSSATVGQKKLVDSRACRCGREAGYSNGEDDSHFDGHLKANA
jgi:hypothetical protein